VQLSLEPNLNAETLAITLKWDELQDKQSIRIIAKNHQGDVLASSQLAIKDEASAILLPELLAAIATGWTNGGSKAMVTAPVAAFRTARKAMNQWGKE
jgi:hypothetical protein